MSETRSAPDIAHGVPPVAMTTDSTLANRTGSWKYIRPIYQDLVAPCNAGCPVGIDIEGWMNLLREGRVAEARSLLLRENPMPAVTGRVCDHPCESACNRAHFDEAVSIHAVERMLGDLADEEEAAAAPAPRRTGRVAVVGSGPAGLACAYHLAHLGYEVEVFEAEAEPGGSLRYAIPEYRLPRAVLMREIERIRRAGVTIRCGVEIGGSFGWKDLEKFDAVFVASGAHVHPALGVDGAELPDVRPALDFLREVADGRAPALKSVVVVGGNHSAVDAARAAVRLGAVATVVFRGAREDLTAGADDVAQAMEEGVRFEFLSSPTGVQCVGHLEDEEALDAIRAMFVETEDGDAGRRVTGLECVRVAAQPADASGRRRFAPVQGSSFFVPGENILVAGGDPREYGSLPPGIEPWLTGVPTDVFGATSRPGIFAGGDVSGAQRTVAHALGAGKRAAIGIDRHLREKAGEQVDGPDPAALRYGGAGNFSMTRWRGDDPVKRANELNEVVPFERLNMAHFAHAPRLPDHLRPAAERRTNFAEANLGLAAVEGMAEARRCFNCGVCNSCEICMIFCPDVAIKRHDSGHGFSLSYKYCKGCGVCVEECPRGAMVMTREGL